MRPFAGQMLSKGSSMGDTKFPQELQHFWDGRVCGSQARAPLMLAPAVAWQPPRERNAAVVEHHMASPSWTAEGRIMWDKARFSDFVCNCPGAPLLPPSPAGACTTPCRGHQAFLPAPHQSQTPLWGYDVGMLPALTIPASTPVNRA